MRGSSAAAEQSRPSGSVNPQSFISSSIGYHFDASAKFIFRALALLTLPAQDPAWV